MPSSIFLCGFLVSKRSTMRATCVRKHRLKSTNNNSWPQSAGELYRLSDRRSSAKLVSTSADTWVSRSQRVGTLRSYSRLSRPKPLLFLSSSSSIVLTRLSEPRSRHTTSQKVRQRRESNPDLWICSQKLSSRPVVLNLYETAAQ
jgi:hypothetical protein